MEADCSGRKGVGANEVGKSECVDACLCQGIETKVRLDFQLFVKLNLHLVPSCYSRCI
jgi:hypothetical protein